MNRIYEGVFGSEWVSGKLAALRPYGEELQKWRQSGNATDLLKGDDLEAAQSWIKGKRLIVEDYDFLQASERNQILQTLEIIKSGRAEVQQNLRIMYEALIPINDAIRNIEKKASERQKKVGDSANFLKDEINELSVEFPKLEQRRDKVLKSETRTITPLIFQIIFLLSAICMTIYYSTIH
jgi:vacuolar-type H+-ATPase subunit I/STV1